ncbi:MAG: GNAT family N-acetyltransferase, partial [Myxococcales bacterium]|nr:GNAT family N-acetyltransferase [Myxococcales bacterium]
MSSGGMLRIRRVQDPNLPSDRRLVEGVQAILRAQFPDAPEKDAAGLPRALVDPFALGLQTLLYVAERRPGVVAAFAWLYHDPAASFIYLDYISTAPRTTNGGLGDALYGAMREVARSLDAHAIYMECLPDDAALCADQTNMAQNRARLRFYERFGATPVVGTGYEEPVGEEPDCPPFLVVDPLDGAPPTQAQARAAVRAILQRKYAWLCPPDYVERVVESFKDDPVRLRAPKYKQPVAATAVKIATHRPRFVLVTSDRHEIHHIRERGYVESPARVR